MTESASRRSILAAIVGVVALLLGAASGYALGHRSGTPDTHSAEAGFARDMQDHHAQAVELSFLIRDRSDDEDIRRIAFDIITSQQQQIGQMNAWLTLWGLPQTGDDPPMAWMSGGGHAGHGSTATTPDTPMMGMASPADMARLTEETGVPAERTYLTLMIAHHKGGVEMAKAVLARTKRPEVRALAQAMVNAQSAEIEALNDLLAKRPA